MKITDQHERTATGYKPSSPNLQNIPISDDVARLAAERVHVAGTPGPGYEPPAIKPPARIDIRDMSTWLPRWSYERVDHAKLAADVFSEPAPLVITSQADLDLHFPTANGGHKIDRPVVFRGLRVAPGHGIEFVAGGSAITGERVEVSHGYFDGVLESVRVLTPEPLTYRVSAVTLRGAS